jgi:site-specific recombinase XerD
MRGELEHVPSSTATTTVHANGASVNGKELALHEPNALVASWSSSSEGARQLEALGAWLSRYRSLHTKKAYSTAIEVFLYWLELRRGRACTPAEVTRADAWAFCREQVEPPEDWVTYRREKALDERGRACSREIAAHPGCSVVEIALQTGLSEPIAHEALTQMVKQNFLSRTPKSAELREGRTNLVGLGLLNIRRYRYMVKPSRPSSAATMAVRLTALSSFWEFLRDTGENTGAAALITHNIWRETLRVYAKRSSNDRQVARAMTTPDEPLYLRMLAQTFKTSHLDALGAAKDWWAGRLVTVPTREPTLLELRDRTLLCWMVSLGLRVDEASRLMVLSIGRDGLVLIHGKGDKQRLVRAPQLCLTVLGEFRAELQRWATPARRDRPRRQDRQGLLGPSSPLFPALGRWGSTSRPNMADRGLSRAGIDTILKRLARQAGVSDDEIRRAHPHGLRHLAAHLAVEAGIPLPTIQRALGHSSIATTSIYVEEHDPSRVCLRPEVRVESGHG